MRLPSPLNLFPPSTASRVIRNLTYLNASKLRLSLKSHYQKGMFAFKTNHSANNELANYFMGTVQWLRCLVASVPLRWLRFNPKPVYGRKKQQWRRVFSNCCSFSLSASFHQHCAGEFHPSTTSAVYP